MNEIVSRGIVGLGEQILRKKLHEALGGQTQSGISPSSKAPVVMLFSDPESGERHGYVDGWDDDGEFFIYSGEGQSGDQVMQRGNKKLRDHEQDHRQLHLFFGSGKGKPVTYIGQFEYVDHETFDGPDTSGATRKVYAYRLRPVETVPPRHRTSLNLATATSVTAAPVEAHVTERMVQEPAHEPVEAERREAQLVQQYRRHLEHQGIAVHRHKIHPAGELRALYTDLYDPERNMLVEAKGTTTRESIRMSIGQLLDYARFIEPRPTLALLLPSLPRPDLLELLAAYEIKVICPDGDGGFDET